jgi:ATP-dependent Clp protease ATP-binding subunit ClpA
MSSNINTNEILRCVQVAHQLADSFSHEYTTLEHLLSALLQEDDVISLVSNLGGNLGEIDTNLAEFFDSGLVPTSSLGPIETDVLKHVVQYTVAQLMFSQRQVAKATDLIVAILQQDNSHAAQFLYEQGVTLEAVKEYLSHGAGSTGADQGAQGRLSGMGGDAPTPDIKTKDDAIKVLAKYASNLNEEAEADRIDPMIGREDQIDQLVVVTARRTKNNGVLIGEPGVGKTAIAEGLALKIVKKEVPEVLHNSVVYSLDIGALMAGTKFRGDLEERMKLVLKALTFIDEPILFIDEIHMIMGAGSGSQGSMDVANLLKPALAKGKLRVIGSTTFEEYRKHFEKDRALQRRFQSINVDEPSIADAKLIVRGLQSKFEEHHGVTYTEEALDAAVELTARYVHNRFLPDKAFDVIDAAGARDRARGEAKRLRNIDVKQIEFEVSKIAKIPEQSVASDESAKLKQLEPNMHSNVFGQEVAISTLTDAVYVSRAGLREDNKPAGAYLFQGPTGVGKTEMARTLADTLGIPLVKFDMSEYMEKHSVAKLIGAPPGYVGHGEGGSGSGLLTNAIEQTPHCVLLLDEIEKAHQDVFNILLQVLDDAKLTNSNGKSVPFNSVYVIMTSNAGAAQMAKSAVGFGSNNRTGEDDDAVNKLFTPEFRNRLDAIVKFNRLKKENMLSIVEKFLKITTTKAAERGIVLNVTQEAKEKLAELGYDPLMGARPLSRVIDDKIKKPLSRVILFGDVKAGSVVNATVEDGEIKVAVAAAKKSRTKKEEVAVE